MLLHRLVYEYPCLVTEDEVKRYAKDFRKLVRLGLLTESQSVSARLCPTCKQELLPLQSGRNGRCFTVCTRSPDVGRDEVNRPLGQIWVFNLPQLLLEIQKAHGSQIAPQELVHADIWLLNAPAKVLFCRSVHPSHHSFLKNMEGYTVILPIPGNHLTPDHVQVVYLTDIITELTYHGLKIATFPPISSRHTIFGQDGDIELNDDVILTADGRLLRRKQQHDRIDEPPRLPPLAQRIIRYLYEIRDHENNSRTLGELAEALSKTESKRSLLNAIRKINTICQNLNILKIISKNSVSRVYFLSQ